VVLDDLSRDPREFVPAKATFVEGSTSDEAAVDTALRSVDACLHFAALIEAGSRCASPSASSR
jgi:UDP-glucose 4-epimerase